jgi:ribosomal protein S18 acetylase RimI-like enzyme
MLPLTLHSAAETPVSFLKLVYSTVYGGDIDLQEVGGLYQGLGLIARSGEDSVGALICNRYRSIDDAHPLYVVNGGILPEHRRKGYGEQLLSCAVTHLRQLSPEHATVILTLPNSHYHTAGQSTENAALWTRLGFNFLDREVLYQRVPYDPGPEKPGGRFRTSWYDGSDHDVNVEISSLYRRMYRNRAGIPDIAPEEFSVEAVAQRPGYQMILLWDGVNLAGEVSLVITPTQCYAESIIVGRRYWGREAADVLGREVVRIAYTKASEYITALIHSTNAASIAFVRRFGLEPGYSIPRLSISW